MRLGCQHHCAILVKVRIWGILGLYRDNGKEDGNDYLGFRVWGTVVHAGLCPTAGLLLKVRPGCYAGSDNFDLEALNPKP